MTDIKNGLDDAVAKERLAKVGPNSVEAKRNTSAVQLLLRQFRSSVVVLLLVATVISFATHDTLQACGILIAVVINAIVGFTTEWKAQVSLEALGTLAGPVARVVRGGKHQEIPASEIVPGDVVIIEAGSRVPADLDLVEAAALTIDESILTGESVPVTKSAETIEGEKETINKAFHGTHVLNGRGRGVVFATGRNSSLGKLQVSLLESERVPTPLETKLDELGKQLSILTVVVCAAVAGVGLLYKYDIWSMLETGIALAVAALPEGLPVVATLALAIGTQRMVRAGVLLRQLAAVETLGCTTVICSDKTGTLTENKLLVTDVYLDGRHLKVSGVGYEPEGSFTENGKAIDSDEILTRLFKAATLCNDARLIKPKDESAWRVAGDPTEGALLAAARKLGFVLNDLRMANPRIAELPFNLVRKKMSTVNKTEDESESEVFENTSAVYTLYSKGSPERIIEDAEFIYTSEGPIVFSELMKREYLKTNWEFADQGLRVLGIAMKDVDEKIAANINEQSDTDLTFLGLVAMKDTARGGVDKAIERCKEAGIKVMMLTGDQRKTAATIARELHILDRNTPETVLEDPHFNEMSEEVLNTHLDKAQVIARVTPELKLAIVRALQKRNNVVAMTGDGVNDAPALQQADIGVAMGQAGTDLAREVSNMVITDDNFTTIVKAIEQGRIIYDNIRRSICYLLTGTGASVLTIATVMIATGMLALNPLQMLWLNLIMHVFPGLGIVLQGAAPGTMQRKPRSPSEKLLESFERNQILSRSVVVALAVLGAMFWSSRLTDSKEVTATIAFATISLALLYQAWAWLFVNKGTETKRERTPINPFMYLMMAISYALVVVAVYLPGLQYVLKTVSLDALHLGIALAASTASVAVCAILDPTISRITEKFSPNKNLVKS